MKPTTQADLMLPPSLSKNLKVRNSEDAWSNRLVMHGYQLLEEIEERSSGCHRLEPGSIYTLLRRMEERGLLESLWEKVEGCPERRIYKLTSKGVEALKMGLASIVRRKRLFEDLVKFYHENFEKPGKGGEKQNV